MSEKWIKFRFGASGSSYGGLVNKCSDDFGQGKPFVTYMNVFSNCKTKDDCFEFVDIGLHEHQNAICKGDVLFTTSSETPDEVGMSSVVTFDPQESVYLNSFCFGFRFSESTNLDPNFSAYLFRGRSVRNFMSMIAQGSTRYNLPKRYLFKDLYLIVPADISTQRHIAEVLSTCDEVIEQSERAAAKYRQIKAGMLKDLLTRGIDNRGKMRPPPSVAPELYKDSELGPIPREWKVKKFEDVLVDDTKCCEKIQTSEYGITGEIPVVDQSQNYISGYVDAEYAVYDKVPVIIFGDHTRVLKYVDFNFVLGADGAKVLQLNDKAVSLRYLYYYLIQNPVPNTGYNRHFSWLRKMQIAIPSNLAEQRAIAERLAAVDERIAAEMKAAEKYRKVKAGLMEKLLTPPADAEIEDLTQEVAG